MSNVKTEIVAGKRKKEKEIQLSKLTPRDVFRFPANTFSEAIESDDGSLFYHVLGVPDKKQIEVISVDFKSRRKLAEETLVIAHDSSLEIFPNT